MFQKAYGESKNIFSPDVLRYGTRGIYVYELSKGTTIHDAPIYGVTVAKIITPRKVERVHELCRAFPTLREAVAYARSMPYTRAR